MRVQLLKFYAVEINLIEERVVCGRDRLDVLGRVVAHVADGVADGPGVEECGVAGFEEVERRRGFG